MTARSSSTPASASSSLHEAARDLFEQPTLALATHYHFDHTGSLHEFPDRLAHRAGVPYLATPGAIGGGLRRDDFSAAAIETVRRGAGYDIPEELLSAWPTPGFDPDGYDVLPMPADPRPRRR